MAAVCYDSLSPSGCRQPLGMCRLRHDITQCNCGLVLDTCNYQSHVRGRRHQQILAGIQPPVSKLGTGGRPKQPCPHCRPTREFWENELQAHVATHTVQERLETALQDAQRNKNGIIVSNLEGIDFGIVDQAGRQSAVFVVLVQRTNQGDVSKPISLKKCRMLSAQKQDDHDIKFSVAVSPTSKFIGSFRPHVVSITFHPSYAGYFEDTLELVFFDISQHRNFVIQRKVCATVGDLADYERLAPKAPYTQRKRRNIALDGPIKRSLRPPTWTPTKWVFKLPQYNIPKNLVETLYTPEGYLKRTASKDVKRFMPPSFTTATYAQHFQTLIYLEEEQMRQDLDAYSMVGVEIKANYPRYELQVDGLAEGRPSVLVGDFILVRPVGQPDKTWFEGRVHNVTMSHVSLRFSDEFNTYRGTKFDVRFVLNRIPFRRMHDALDNKNDPARFLFPGPEHLTTAGPVTSAMLEELVPLNRDIGRNREQLETVAAIVHQPKGSVPFIVFGPPGTGKTVTIVEAIEQLLKRDPNTRILACTPNNSAADLITQKLMHLGATDVFRMNSMTRKFGDLPKTLHKFSLINDNQAFAMPTLEGVLNYRVVVSTCVSAGALRSLGVKPGHFECIFIDEAGQGKEPEIMIPIKGLANNYTNVVLAGDLKQLGPIVHSRLARDLGLKESYLARLMQRPCYGLSPWDGGASGGLGVVIMQLIKNFRSHPDILAFPNEQFYGNLLQACGDPLLTKSLENSVVLPTKKFPIVFHSVVGRDQREESSPSFFNISEATLVKSYCTSLMAKKGTRAEHIGVITPYHAQRMKILDLFYRDPKLRDIRVGSTEEFQGQERRIIIMSTVRSNAEFITSDIRRTLGFVASPYRFNVAVTRAQALLLVIGNSDVLAFDPLWRSFMNYIHIRGGWRGHRISWDPKASVDDYVEEVRSKAAGEVEETMARLKALIVNVADGGDAIPPAETDDEEIDGGLGDGLVMREED
ncbi:P-loop containing nucleoside triphosphate hydrolase protein [Desarmillaria tabescens]|uniref:RNA helicase n=1 Tax=Armillaria tabescens TaxID=1929756 RepID=A0AA39MZY1_ARMTA|nr:P-loop containing nucleoside triphosphate hydrolase protein [Desarmillaria tabescens]KAK0452060.1 P-loop containing nucleoside triphosphate hydrolase protein [Desarmillaria tabescens]